MRALVQRVTEASVTVEGDVVGRVDEPGLLVLVGVTHSDDEALAGRMANKLAGLRVLRDEQSVLDAGAPVLVISQFTLYGDARKGRRPTWNAAAPGEVAEPIVDVLVDALRALGVRVQTGRFGAEMRVALVNDGPVTLLVVM